MPHDVALAMSDSVGRQAMDGSASGLEAIIDACAGVLAEQSLESTLQAMADRLHEIVPFTSLAIFEVDDEHRYLVPMFAQGQHIDATLASRPALEDSISGRAVLDRRLIHLEPGHPWLRRHQMPGTPDDEPEALIVAPLLVAGAPVGTLNVWREHEGASFSDDDAELVSRFATLAALAYSNARQRERLRQQAVTDDLTATFNRRYFHQRLGGELAEALRHDYRVGLVVLDIDDFKAINDRFGHEAGDVALRAVADALCGCVRGGDVVCRTGGEEFAIIAPHVDDGEPRSFAERLVETIAAAGLGPHGGLTISAGLAVAPAEADAPETLFRLADRRLLDAKAAGKNQARCWSA